MDLSFNIISISRNFLLKIMQGAGIKKDFFFSINRTLDITLSCT